MWGGFFHGGSLLFMNNEPAMGKLNNSAALWERREREKV